MNEINERLRREWALGRQAGEREIDADAWTPETARAYILECRAVSEDCEFGRDDYSRGFMSAIRQHAVSDYDTARDSVQRWKHEEGRLTTMAERAEREEAFARLATIESIWDALERREEAEMGRKLRAAARRGLL